MKTINKIMIIAFVFLLSAVVANAQGPNKAYADNMKLVDSVLVGSVMQPVFAIFTGDINQDGYIDIGDLPVLLTEIEGVYPYGYKVEDLSGDGYIDIGDLPILQTNINAEITLLRPY